MRAVVFLKSVYSCYVRMIQRREEFGFTFKASKPICVLRELFGKSLDSDFTPELCVSGLLHLAHATLDEGRNDFIVCKF